MLGIKFVVATRHATESTTDDGKWKGYSFNEEGVIQGPATDTGDLQILFSDDPLKLWNVKLSTVSRTKAVC